jgi:hypothetical protein
VLGQVGEQLRMGRAQRAVDLAVVLARLMVEAAAVEAAAVADAARAEVLDRPAALGDVHPQTPVLVALLRGLGPAPAVDLLQPGAAKEGGDGVLVGVGDAVGIEPLRHRSEDLAVAELEDVADAGRGVGGGLEAVGHLGQDAGLEQIVAVERHHQRRAGLGEPDHPGLGDASVALQPDDADALLLDPVERAMGGVVARGVVDDDDLDRLRLLDRVDRVEDERALLMAGHDHRQSGLRLGLLSTHGLSPWSRLHGP